MAYTATDLANIQAAILALAAGTRVVSVSVNNKTITYGQAQIKELQALCDEIKADVAAAANTKRFVLTRTEKGL